MALGAATTWWLGMLVATVAACVLTLAQLRVEVREMREAGDEADA
jgi:hypothetical protein